jgi:hypothetical protein
MPYTPYYRRKPDDPKHDDFDKRNQRIAKIAVIVLALTAGIMAWQAIETHRAVEESAKATDAANRQASIAEDTEERQLRAYLTISPKVLVVAVGQKPVVYSDLNNSGQTPAYDIAVEAGVDPMAAAPEPNWPTCAAIYAGTRSRLFVGKSMEFDKPSVGPISQAQIDAVQSGLGNIYFAGRFCYRDAFYKIQHTDFCFRWLWNGTGWSKPIGCARGNTGS